MAKYLDDNGLLYLWGKLKAAFTNVQADWNESNSSSDAYIKNKPNIPSGVVVDDAMSSTSENPVQNKVIYAALGNYAPLASPALTGTPTAPTATAGTSTTQIATTAFVSSAISSAVSGVYKYKGSVETASLLPVSGQVTGDVYNIESSSIYGGPGANVAWNGSAWDSLGEIFTITSITNGEIDVIVAT